MAETPAVKWLRSGGLRWVLLVIAILIGTFTWLTRPVTRMTNLELRERLLREAPLGSDSGLAQRVIEKHFGERGYVDSTTHELRAIFRGARHDLIIRTDIEVRMVFDSGWHLHELVTKDAYTGP